MDEKDGKKKESIDDILSDLNGLLNKMPSILDGIKMPDIKPVEFQGKPPAAVPGPETGKPPARVPGGAGPGAFDGDKTVVINSMSRLPEGAELPPAGSADASFGAPEEIVAPAAGAVPQAGLTPAGAGDSSADLAIPDIDALLQFTQDVPAEPQPGERASLQPALPPGEEPAAEPAPGTAFGAAAEEAPEIALDAAPLNLPEAAPETALDPAPEIAPGPTPETVADPVPEISVEPVVAPAAELPSDADLAEFEKQLSGAIMPEAGAGRGAEEPAREAEPAAGEESAPVFDAPVLEPAPELSLGVSDIAPAGGETAASDRTGEPPAAAAGGETMEILPSGDPAADNRPEGEQQPAPEGGLSLPEAAAAPEGEATIQLEPQPQVAGEPQLSIPDPFAETAQAGAQGEPSPEPAPAVGEAPQEPQLSVGGPAPAPAPADAGDATLVVAPSQFGSGGSGEEEKTVVFQAAVGPGVTSRAKLEDLDALSNKAAPEGIPPERVRPLMFLYAPSEGALCANLLAELDAICSRSLETPMFVKRAGVQQLDVDMNANFVLQTTTDSGAVGLVCVGEVPQEKLYEIENVFNSSGAMFRHYDRATFNHSAMLDLLLEVILR